MEKEFGCPNKNTTVCSYNTTADGKYAGYIIDMLKALSVQLNFEYELYEVPDGKNGMMNDKGEWNGMVRELIEDVSRTL